MAAKRCVQIDDHLREPKKSLCVFCSHCRDMAAALITAVSNEIADMGQVFWLISAALRFRPKGTGHQVWGVGLDHQTILGNHGDEISQMQSATFVTDLSRDTDMQIKVDVCLHGFALAGKTVNHCFGKVISIETKNISLVF